MPPPPERRPGDGVCTSIIVPAYNEEANIEGVVKEALKALEELGLSHEVLVGNDGSTDGTRAILDELAAGCPRVRVFHSTTNKGVARTCLALYRQTLGDVVAFFPGDGQVRPGQIANLLKGKDLFDVVVGFRRDRQDPLHRRLNAWLWNGATRLLFGLPVRDVDSVKLFPGDFIRSVPVQSESPFMETEILIRARGSGLRVGNVDVDHLPRTGGRNTGARPTVIVHALGEMMRFWIRQHSGGWRARTPQ